MDSAATQQTFKKLNTNVSGSKENDGKAGGGDWKYGKEGGGNETKRRKHGMGEESEETKMTISLLKEGKETVKHCLQAAVSQASSEYLSPLSVSYSLSLPLHHQNTANQSPSCSYDSSCLIPSYDATSAGTFWLKGSWWIQHALVYKMLPGGEIYLSLSRSYA